MGVYNNMNAEKPNAQVYVHVGINTNIKNKVKSSIVGLVTVATS